MRKSNYELMSERMRGEFLKYDAQRMIRNFSLEHDERYLYLRYCGRNYRIDRASGLVEWSADGFATCGHAGYGEVMPIYDALCCAKDGCALSGAYMTVNSLKSVANASSPGGGLFDDSANAFAGRTEALRAACEALGGEPQPKGDVSYKLNTFDFLPVILRFYDADDEFPASMQFLWDANTLDFVRFETTFYIAGNLLSRIRELMDA